MFSSVWNKIKEIVQKMIGVKAIEQQLHLTPTASGKMADAIKLWGLMYEGEAPWIREATYGNPVRVASLGLPALIASEKARMATIEMESKITSPIEKSQNDNTDVLNNETENNSDDTKKSLNNACSESQSNPRAEFLNTEYAKLKKHIRRQLEYGIAKGGLVIKPYVVKRSNATSEAYEPTGENDADSVAHNNTQYNIDFDFIQADNFFPLSFDANGHITEAAFIQSRVDKDMVYRRLEYHQLKDNVVTVQNRAFKAQINNNDMNYVNDDDFGIEVPLSSIEEWKSIEPEVKIKDVDRLLFAYFKMPEANTVDTYSPLGVSGYSRVVNLIKDADMQYSRLLWEFEGGELAIDVDRDALKLVTDEEGNDRTVVPLMQERLFRKIDLNSEDTYNVFAPSLRDDSLINGLNTILVRIEDATGLSRGTISDITVATAKTATELKLLKQRSYATNADIQMALEDALRDVIYIMDVYCTLYSITPEGKYDVSFTWDDSILVDVESELSKRITLMQNGISSKIETRMWYFGETENQAKEAIALIEAEQQRQMDMMNSANQLEKTSGSDDKITKDAKDSKNQKIANAEKSDGKNTQGKPNNNKNLEHNKIKGVDDSVPH